MDPEIIEPRPKAWPKVLAGVIISALVFGGAAYAWQNQKLNDVKTSKDAEVALAKAQAKETSGHAPAQEFLEIPELGIKLPISEKLNGLTYAAGDVNGTKVAYFSTAKLMSADFRGGSDASKYYCDPYWGPIGAIAKDSPATQQPAESKKISSHTYDFSTPQATCSETKTVIDVQGESAKALQQAFSKAEAL